MRLLLAFTVIPALEIWLLMRIGSVIGGFETFLLVIVTGVIGANLARSQGFAVLNRLQQEAHTGLPTGSTLAQGVMILIGGVLLITPGVLTDLFGLALITPITREFFAPRIIEALKKGRSGSFQFHTMGGGAAGGPFGGPFGGHPGAGFPGGPPYGGPEGGDQLGEAEPEEPSSSIADHFDHPVR